jgi:osmotically inducible protein OsmC
MNVLYTAVAQAHGGREGKVTSSDPALSLSLSMPKGLGGPGGDGTNPEQLFASGYAACFESALRLVARMKKTPLADASITAHVSLLKEDNGAFKLKVALHGSLPGRPRDEAEALMKAAHEVCPYSRATRGNIDVTLAVDEA